MADGNDFVATATAVGVWTSGAGPVLGSAIVHRDGSASRSHPLDVESTKPDSAPAGLGPSYTRPSSGTDFAKRWTVVSAKHRWTQAYARLNERFGQAPVVAMALVVGIGLAISLIAFGFFNSAAPSSVTITSGPDGSAFTRYAQQYQKILAQQGVTLKILPSQGSRDNLRRLADNHTRVDVGFVLGGETNPGEAQHLYSLGSISYQPMMIFYRGAPKARLSEFKGMRLDIGPAGSGSNVLAQALLAANGIHAGDGTVYIDTSTDDTVRALHEQRIDAFFAMSESTPNELMRELLRAPDVHLFNFTQATGYSRRFAYLHKLQLPQGSLDFGENIPAEDVELIASTVELVARENLHPAISDLLLEAAREVHGKPGLYKERGEFPAPLENEFRISPDATRYYASGKSFLYRTFPFWAASLIARLVAFVVPAALVLIPGIRLVPAIYRWRMTARIYRWYGALQRLEQDALDPKIDPRRREELMHRLDQIERTVLRLVVPSAFGDVFYALRSHIGDVRNSLLAAQAAATPSPVSADGPAAAGQAPA